jgi:hypothetical protein
MTVSEDTAQSYEAQWAAAEKAATAATATTPEVAEPKAEAKEAPADDSAAEQPVATDDPKPEAEATEPETDDADDGDPESRNIRDRERLEKLAKKLGLAIDGDRVSIEDRVKFRDEQRQRQKALRARSEELDAKMAKLLEEDKAKGEKYHKLARAIEETDLDTIAAELGAKSWDELNRQFLINRSSPHAKEMAALKKKLAEQETAAQTAKREREEQARAIEVEKERKAYFAELSDDVDDAEDEGIRAMAKVDGFKELVLRQEQDAYDPERNVTITRAEAMKRAHDVALKQYQALHAVFSKTAAVEPVSGKRGKRPSTVEASAGKTKGLGDFDTTTKEGNDAWLKAAEALFKHG